MQAISLSGGTQRNVDLVAEENRKLRSRLEKLNNEHRDLKRAYWELSLSLSHQTQVLVPTQRSPPSKSLCTGLLICSRRN